MYTKVLVPLDQSPLAETILPHISELALKLGMEVILLVVVPTFEQALRETLPRGGFEGGSNPQVGVDAAQQAVNAEHKAATLYLENVAKNLQAQGIKVRSVVAEGAPAAAVLHQAQADNVSLIAMCTHGRSGIQRTFLGSVSDEVLRHVNIPVLVLRPAET